jgi:IS5 family transposase
MPGDKAYDSAELREELDELGTAPVITNRGNRKQPFPLQQASLKASLAHRSCIQQAKGLPPYRNAL